MRVLSVCVLLGVLTAGAAAQNTRKYEVTVTPDKNANFAALKTYAWTRGTPANDKKVDQEIVAAVDHELSGLGLTKKAPVVVLLDPKNSDRRLLTARADKPLDAEPAKVEALINEVVAEMFAKYPTRQSAR